VSLRIGGKEVKVKAEVSEKPTITRIAFDPTKMRPLFLTYDEFCLLAQRLDLPEALDEPKEKKGKEWINYLRVVGRALGKIFYMIISHPSYVTPEGVSVASPSETEE